MNLSRNSQFGLIVAYLLPGFIGLAGLAPFLPTVAAWLHPTTYAEASLGPPVYALLAATTIGMIASSVRWLIIDHIHESMGLKPPVWDDRQLERRLDAFNYLVESHYRYYQFVANTLVAAVGTYAINRWMATLPFLGLQTDVALVLLCIALFAASRDNLSKYYTRTERLIGHALGANRKDDIMTNGNHHEAGNTESTKPRPNVKPDAKPQRSPKPEQKKPKATQQQK